MLFASLSVPLQSGMLQASDDAGSTSSLTGSDALAVVGDVPKLAVTTAVPGATPLNTLPLTRSTDSSSET